MLQATHHNKREDQVQMNGKSTSLPSKPNTKAKTTVAGAESPSNADTSTSANGRTIIRDPLLQTASLDVWKISVKSPSPAACAIADEETPKSNPSAFIVAAIFCSNKVTKSVVEELDTLLQSQNRSASGLYIDISAVDTVNPDVFRLNVDMIKRMSQDANSTIRRVAICCGKLMRPLFTVLMKTVKPKVETRAFDVSEEALGFLLATLSVSPQQ